MTPLPTNWVLSAKRLYWEFRANPYHFSRHGLILARCAFEAAGYIARGHANFGTCPICERHTVFIERDPWLRDNYLCIHCRSVPRFRAIIYILQQLFPNYRDLSIHESSPSGASSLKLARECKDYSASQFFQDVRPGEFRHRVRCENLEAMTFMDATFDLFVTQDVMEHVMTPAAGFAEIARVLKPGGAHLFTVPYDARHKTRVRALAREGQVTYLADEVYHRNPIDPEGSLVVTDWGWDLPDRIHEASGLTTTVYQLRDRALGLDAEYLEVFVSRKGDTDEGHRAT